MSSRGLGLIMATSWQLRMDGHCRQRVGDAMREAGRSTYPRQDGGHTHSRMGGSAVCLGHVYSRLAPCSCLFTTYPNLPSQEWSVQAPSPVWLESTSVCKRTVYKQCGCAPLPGPSCRVPQGVVACLQELQQMQLEASRQAPRPPADLFLETTSRADFVAHSLEGTQ
jgi:hypothetical protein